MIQIREKKVSELQSKKGGSFDPLTTEERAEKNRQELEALMDKLAFSHKEAGRRQKKNEKKQASDSPASDTDSEAEEKHNMMLKFLKGPKPKAHKPTETERLQIALKQAQNRAKAEKKYYEEEQEYLRDLVRVISSVPTRILFDVPS